MKKRGFVLWVVSNTTCMHTRPGLHIDIRLLKGKRPSILRSCQDFKAAIKTITGKFNSALSYSLASGPEQNLHRISRNTQVTCPNAETFRLGYSTISGIWKLTCWLRPVRSQFSISQEVQIDSTAPFWFFCKIIFHGQIFLPIHQLFAHLRIARKRCRLPPQRTHFWALGQSHHQVSSRISQTRLTRKEPLSL